MSVLIIASFYFGGKKYDDILKCNDFLFSFLYDSRNVVTGGLGMIIMTVLSISEHRTSTAHELSPSVTNN